MDQIIIFILHEVGIFFFSISFYIFCLGFQVTVLLNKINMGIVILKLIS